MKYLLTGLFIGVLIAAAIALVLLIRGKFRSLLTKGSSRKLYGIGFILVVLAALVGLGVSYQKFWRTQPVVVKEPKAATLQKVDVKPTPAGLPQYQIIGRTGSAENSRLQVITKETDGTRLIQLNDYLYTTYKGVAKSFFIDYFDDKAVASTYFAKQTSPSVSKAEKDQLYRHYIAIMVDAPFMPNKVLYRQGRPPVELKRY